MKQELAAASGANEAMFPAGTAGVRAGAKRPRERLGEATERFEARVPLRWRLAGIGVLGALAATGVGYLASVNPQAAPAPLAVAGRVSIIVVLVAAGAYAQTSRLQARMGRLLVAAGFVSCLWLLNGSRDRFAFSVAVLVSGLVPVMFCSLLLVHPTGRAATRIERRFIIVAAAVIGIPWLLLCLTSAQPQVTTPLLRCAPHCPSNAFFLGFTTSAAPLLKFVGVGMWIVLACGTPVLIALRARSAPAPLRRSLAPAMWAAIWYAAFLVGYLALRATVSGVATTLGNMSLATAIMVPLAILLGLVLERLLMGKTLADLVTTLAEQRLDDPRALLATTLQDPTLQVGYLRPSSGRVVDSAGAAVDTAKLAPGRAITWIERDRRPLAAVIYNAELADQERFIHAAGAAALMRLEQTQLQADLKASLSELAASRIRLVETAYAERKRIERDLHDSVQQDLVSLRIKLDMSRELLVDEPERGQRMIASVGEQIDEILETLRSLARGIYPALLDQQGLGEALKSAARRSPVSVSVDARRVGRQSQDVEVAVYYCCLEALQNVAKHAGPHATAAVRVWCEPLRLCFEVRDTGIGFDPSAIHAIHGLVNMSDRIEAVGGTLSTTSRTGRGTLVSGRIPIA